MSLTFHFEQTLLNILEEKYGAAGQAKFWEASFTGQREQSALFDRYIQGVTHEDTMLFRAFVYEAEQNPRLLEHVGASLDTLRGIPARFNEVMRPGGGQFTQEQARIIEHILSGASAARRLGIQLIPSVRDVDIQNNPLLGNQRQSTTT